MYSKLAKHLTKQFTKLSKTRKFYTFDTYRADIIKRIWSEYRDHKIPYYEFYTMNKFIDNIQFCDRRNLQVIYQQASISVLRDNPYYPEVLYAVFELADWADLTLEYRVKLMAEKRYFIANNYECLLDYFHRVCSIEVIPEEVLFEAVFVSMQLTDSDFVQTASKLIDEWMRENNVSTDELFRDDLEDIDLSEEPPTEEQIIESQIDRMLDKVRGITETMFVLNQFDIRGFWVQVAMNFETMSLETYIVSKGHKLDVERYNPEIVTLTCTEHLEYNELIILLKVQIEEYIKKMS